MAQNDVVIRFNEVSFKYSDKKVILDEASFSVRRNSIMTIMGQNGAGKSTIFKLLLGELTPQSGKINMELGTRVGIAKQMIPPEQQDLDIVSYFKTALPDKEYGIEGDIIKILKVVNLNIALTRIVKSLSGGQKARLLLAYALISEPDVLLLDEPTNNLDSTGIEHLTTFLIEYKKTCLAISHDADFLNCFTDGVINLDVATKKTEQFDGNYYDVLSEMAAKLERDRLLNSRLEKSIKDRFEKINKLGGKSIAMSQLARRIREDIEEDRQDLVDMRREDKTIPNFTIRDQEYVGQIGRLTKPVELGLNKGTRVLIKGPNGIGKSTLLKSILSGQSAQINPEVRIGYYSQDFSELDFDQTGYESLYSISQTKRVQDIYEAGGRFLLSSEILNNKVEAMSEGQKGLLCYARFMLQVPGILILDEPTNHINFRHIPVIAEAINNYKGPIIFVSHLADFVDKIKITTELDLEKYRK